MLAGERDSDTLARILLVCYAVQAAISRATSLAVELLGGMTFIRSAEISYLLAAARPLCVHLPCLDSCPWTAGPPVPRNQIPALACSRARPTPRPYCSQVAQARVQQSLTHQDNHYRIRSSQLIRQWWRRSIAMA